LTRSRQGNQFLNDLHRLNRAILLAPDDSFQELGIPVAEDADESGLLGNGCVMGEFAPVRDLSDGSFDQRVDDGIRGNGDRPAGAGEKLVIQVPKCADVDGHGAAGRGQPAAEGGRLEAVWQQHPDLGEGLIREKLTDFSNAGLRLSSGGGREKDGYGHGISKTSLAPRQRLQGSPMYPSIPRICQAAG